MIKSGSMDVSPDKLEAPIDPSLKRSLMRRQGSVSYTYTLEDRKTREKFVHKIMSTDQSAIYGGEKMPILKRAKKLQRIHSVLSEIFEGRVVETQFLLASSKGKAQIDIVQPFVKGEMVSFLPCEEGQKVFHYIDEKGGGWDQLTNTIADKAHVSIDFAGNVVAEIHVLSNWIKDSKSGEAILVDF
ncbi:MAG TPA: hypothetical protein VMR19_00715 [Candidatus Saccharimonadales bacterium]|nr:hypothetical protein [Candidatus Saccharimonadales bacterium]